MSKLVVRVRGASKRYRDCAALDDVSLDLHAGRSTGLIGANGAGKSTLIRAIAGVLTLDRGSIEKSADARSLSGLGYLPEERGLYARQSPLRTLQYLAELRGMSSETAVTEAREWLQRVAMPDFDTRRLEQFSKGQQQKAQLAAAFMGCPALIMLDEPFSGLDPLNVRVVRTLLDDARRRGAAILLSAHQLALVQEWCDDVVMLAGGRVVMNDNVSAVRARESSLEEAFVARTQTGGES